jgi:hypothetical protein
MRLWSLHPKYLDPKGLVALWREGLLAQAVLAGQTRGYKHHPQLARFLQTPEPLQHMAAYLQQVHAEAVARGYHFDETKISPTGSVEPMSVTKGQLAYEWLHLNNKLKARSPAWLAQIKVGRQPAPHPLFQVVAGGIAEWEVITAQPGVPAMAPARKSK